MTTADHRIPIPRAFETAKYRERLFELLRDTRRFCDALTNLTAAWERAGCPDTLARRDAGYRGVLVECAVDLELVSDGTPPEWVLQALHREVAIASEPDWFTRNRMSDPEFVARLELVEVENGRLAGSEEPITQSAVHHAVRIPVRADELHLVISVSPNHAEVDVSDPCSGETLETRSIPAPKDKPLQFDAWDELRKSARAAADAMVDRLEAEYRNRLNAPSLDSQMWSTADASGMSYPSNLETPIGSRPAELVERNPGSAARWDLALQRLAGRIGGVAGVTYNRSTRRPIRTVCDIIGIDEPPIRRKVGKKFFDNGV